MLKALYKYYFGPLPEDKMGREMHVHGPVMHRMTLGYLILAFGIVFGLYQQSQISSRAESLAQQSNRALCIQKENAQRTVNDTEAYVRSDTDGFVFGIPTPVLKRSIEVNKKLVASLSDVDCG